MKLRDYILSMQVKPIPQATVILIAAADSMQQVLDKYSFKVGNTHQDFQQASAPVHLDDIQGNSLLLRAIVY